VLAPVAVYVSALGPLGKFGYIFDSSAGPKILIKTFAKIEENVMEAKLLGTTKKKPKMWWENMRDEAAAREQALRKKKKRGFFDWM